MGDKGTILRKFVSGIMNDLRTPLLKFGTLPSIYPLVKIRNTDWLRRRCIAREVFKPM